MTLVPADGGIWTPVSTRLFWLQMYPEWSAKNMEWLRYQYPGQSLVQDLRQCLKRW